MNSHVCLFCGESRDPESGVYIRGYYICPGCEIKICCLTVDSANYEYYRNGLKRIWCLADTCSPWDEACFWASLARR
nr:sigma factor G inhibitor Gin [Desulfallas thermosapovorans]